MFFLWLDVIEWCRSCLLSVFVGVMWWWWNRCLDIDLCVGVVSVEGI